MFQILLINLYQDKKKDKEKNKNILDSINAFYEGREFILNTFRSGIFPTNEEEGKGLKILSPKQMLQRLPRALAHVKAGNISENFVSS